jgi:hypothetical protein
MSNLPGSCADSGTGFGNGAVCPYRPIFVVCESPKRLIERFKQIRRGGDQPSVSLGSPSAIVADLYKSNWGTSPRFTVSVADMQRVV